MPRTPTGESLFGGAPELPACVVWDTPDFDSLAARGYVHAVVEVVALVDLWGSFTSPEQKHAFNQTFYGPCISQLQDIYRLGQERGEFGGFDLNLMTHILQGALDGVMLQWVFDPNVYCLTDCTRPLADTFLQQATLKF